MDYNAKLAITDIFRKYVDAGMSVIPVRSKYDDKKDVFVGKIPMISNWQRFCNELPDYDDIDEWDLLSSTGIGLCVGPASGLCCIDIDEKDAAIKSRVLDAIPYTPLSIIGDPMKGGKYIYRISDENREMINPIVTLKKDGIASVEFFFDRKQVVLPPSKHTIAKDGTVLIRYEWEDKSRAEMALKDIDAIPEIDAGLIQVVKNIIDGTVTNREILQNSPVTNTKLAVEETGRFNDMNTYISKLVRDGETFENILIKLKTHDLSRNKENPFFLDRTKGFDSGDMDRNIYKFALQTTAGFKERVSVPQIIIDPKELKKDFNKPLLKTDMFLDDITIDQVPPIARDFCRSIHESTPLSIFGAYMVIMTALSPLIGNKRVVQAKRNDKEWKKTINIFTSICQPPGSRKTEIIKRGMKFLKEMQKRQDMNYEPILTEFMKGKEYRDGILKALKKKLKLLQEAEIDMGENVSEVHKQEVRELIDRIFQLEQENIPPKKKQFIIGNVTHERMMQIAEETETGNLLYTEELNQLIKLFNKSGNEGLRETVMDGWDGSQSTGKDTKTQGKIDVEQFTLSVLSGVQPEPLSNHLNKMKKNKDEMDGFWHRFIYIVAKAPQGEELDVEFNPDKMGRLLEAFHAAYSLEKSEEPVTLDDQAYKAFMSLASKDNKLKTTEHDEIVPFISKRTGTSMVLAYLDAFLRQGGDIKTIKEESVLMAYRMLDVSLQHVKELLSVNFDNDVSKCIMLMREGAILDGMKIKDLKRVAGFFNDVTYRHEVVTELKKRNIIRIDNNEISINPDIYAI